MCILLVLLVDLLREKSHSGNVVLCVSVYECVYVRVLAVCRYLWASGQ